VVTGRRSSALVAAVVLLVGGCSSDDPEELSLEDSSAAAAPEEGDEAEASDGEPAEDAADAEQESPGDAEEQLYPPLPPLEPNPDSDVPVEDQEFYLELYKEYHRVTSEAVATSTWDEGALSQVAAGQELENLRGSIKAARADGTVLVFDDTRIEWVEVVQVQGGTALVQECRIDGAGSGRADAETRNVTDEADASIARVLQVRYATVEQDDGTFAPRVTELLTAEDEERCRA
jgi:hypothetical protein